MITVQDNFIRLNVWETANNASYVTLSMALEKNDAHPIRNVVGTLRIGGKTKSINITSANYDGSGTVLYTWSASIPYDNDTVMTLTTSFEGSYEIYNTPTQAAWNYNSVSRVGYYTATRPSTKAISTNKDTITIGTDSVTITTSGGSSGALTWKVGNNAAQTIATVGNTTTTWSPTLATAGMSQAMSSVPNSANMTCTLTWNGVSKNITLKIPNNSSTKPTISSIAMAVAGSTVGGLYVQGKSNAKATVTASGNYGATIPSTGYSISLNGQTYTSNPATSGLLTTAGTNTCTVTVTDSRGFQSTASQTFTVTAYSSPKINNVSIYRSNASNVADVSGTYITFKFTPSITALSNNNAKNYGIEYRQSGSSWPSPTTGVLSSYTAAATYTSSQVNATTLYEARAYIQDSFEKVYSAVFTIPTAEVIMDFNTAGTGGGIGMYTQKAGQLDVAWDTYVHGRFKAPDGLFLQDLESKNLLQITAATQATNNGVTITVNADKSISMSGTATAAFNFTIGSAVLEAGSYILTGATGGSASTAYLNIPSTTNDTGSGSSVFTVSAGTYSVRILGVSGANVTGKRFYPMIRRASVNDSTYVPRVMTATEREQAYPATPTPMSYNASVNAVTSRGSISSGGVYALGSLVFVSLVFSASASATNSPQIATLPAALNDTALSAIDITSGIGSSIDSAVPCGVAANGKLYIKTITSGHIYAISGVYPRG